MGRILTLVFTGGPQKGSRLQFDQSRVTIGRNKENDLSISDPFVSGRHTILSQREGAWVLSDAGSQNGTKLNGAVVKEALLREGDRIEIGETAMTVSLEGPSPSVPKPAASIGAIEGGKASSPGKEPAEKARAAGLGLKSIMRRPVVWVAAGVVVLLVVLVLVLGGEKTPPLPPQSAEPIPVPARGTYGNLRQDQSHIDKAVFSFMPSGPRHLLRYAPGGIDEGEVAIFLNGYKIGQAAPSREWIAPQEIVLPAEYILPGQVNTVTFDNVRNPPGRETWGVRDVSVIAAQVEGCSREQAQKEFEQGRRRYEQRVVSPDNLYLAIEAFKKAARNAGPCEPKPAFLAEATQMIKEGEESLEKAYQNQRFEAEKALRFGDRSTARDRLANIMEMIPDPADPRHAYAKQKLEQIPPPRPGR